MYKKILKILIDNKWFDKTNRINANKIRSNKPNNNKIKKLIVDATNFLPDTAKLKERIACIKNNITEIVKCDNPKCNNPVMFCGESHKIYREFCCLRCAQSDPNVVAKKKKTCFMHHGVDVPSQSESIRKKQQQTTLERYGVSYASQTKEAKIKTKNTNLNKYGTVCSLQNKTVAEKSKKTNLEKYGTENVINNPIIKEKIKQTNLMRFGTEYPLQNNAIMEKTKQTRLRKYGVEHVFQRPDMLLKQSNTVLERYNVKNFNQIHISEESLKCLNNKDWLIEHHHNKKYSVNVICNMLEVTYTCVKAYLNKFNIKVRRYGISVPQKELFDYIQSIYSNEVVMNNRDILGNKLEIDILIPEIKLGIEMNGVFWHSEANGKNDSYHINKTKTLLDKNILLLQIYDYEWDNYRNVIEAKLLQFFHHPIPNINFGRIDIISNTLLINDFVCQNSLIKPPIDNDNIVTVGIFDEITPLSLIGFSSLSNGKWKIVYHPSVNYTNIQDNISRILNYFISTYKPSSIIIDCDARFADHLDFITFGFNKINWTEPQCRYFDRNNPYVLHETPDFNCKHIEKIWDCGLLQLELKL